jgi:DNA-binding NarL/FixJ family response regulator
MQIIQRLFEGAQEGEIAGALGISVHTVHTHLGRIYRKLGVRSLPGMLLRVFGVYVNAVEQDAAGFSGGCSASDPSRARQEAVPARAAPTTARNDVTAPSRSRLG